MVSKKDLRYSHTEIPDLQGTEKLYSQAIAKDKSIDKQKLFIAKLMIYAAIVLGIFNFQSPNVTWEFGGFGISSKLFGAGLPVILVVGAVIVILTTRSDTKAASTINKKTKRI